MAGYNDCFDLSGKLAVVTGAAGLIGAEVARGLSNAGADVVVADIDKEKGTVLAGQLSKAKFYKMDITSETSVKNLIKTVHKKYGKIDAWANCAYPRTADWSSRLEDIPVSSWKKKYGYAVRWMFYLLSRGCRIHVKAEVWVDHQFRFDLRDKSPGFFCL